MKSSAQLIVNAFMLGFQEPARQTFRDSASELHVAQGHEIFRFGEPADCFYLVCKGVVEETYPVHGLAPQLLTEGEVIEASSLAPPGLRLSSATARTDVDMLMFDCESTRQLGETDNLFGSMLYQRLFAVMVERLATVRGLSV
jgi:CRP-like cAMP-binding protein